jgi:hypothetical protein
MLIKPFLALLWKCNHQHYEIIRDCPFGRHPGSLFMVSRALVLRPTLLFSVDPNRRRLHDAYPQTGVDCVETISHCRMSFRPLAVSIYFTRTALLLLCTGTTHASRADSICVTSSRKRHDLYQRLCSSLGTAATNYADSCSARASPTRGCTKVSASCPRKRSTR